MLKRKPFENMVSYASSLTLFIGELELFKFLFFNTVDFFIARKINLLKRKGY